MFLKGTVKKVYIECEGSEDIEVKIQPMEVYSTPHGRPPKLHEEERYPYTPLHSEGDGVYSTVFSFEAEGRYSVKIRRGGEVVQQKLYL